MPHSRLALLVIGVVLIAQTAVVRQAMGECTWKYKGIKPSRGGHGGDFKPLRVTDSPFDNLMRGSRWLIEPCPENKTASINAGQRTAPVGATWLRFFPGLARSRTRPEQPHNDALLLNALSLKAFTKQRTSFATATIFRARLNCFIESRIIE
jgi:hypothetical protein